MKNKYNLRKLASERKKRQKQREKEKSFTEVILEFISSVIGEYKHTKKEEK